MNSQGIDPTLLDDAALVARARCGDRLAFGVLYLRHGEAAWRVACTVSGFSADAELAVIEGFTAVFATLPGELEPDTRFRPHLLASVRQVALDRLPRRSLAGRRRRQPSAAASVVEPDVLILSGVEHHLLVGALRSLPERGRSALWLTEVERMTPSEAADVLGLEPARVTAVAAQAREHIVETCLEAQRRAVFRPGCQHTVERLGLYVKGELTPRERVMIKAHLDRCLPCRMRRSEVTDVAGSLIGALPALPLLGGECQRHWLAFGSAAARPTRRRAAAGPRRVPVQAAVAAAMLAFLFGLTAAVTPRASSPRTTLAAPAASEASDVPPPYRPARQAEPEVALLAVAATPTPAQAPAPSSAPPAPARPQAAAAGTFAAAAKRPEKLAITPAAVPVSSPPPAVSAPPPSSPVPVQPAGVAPQAAPPAPGPSPAPASSVPAPEGKGKRDRDRDEDDDRASKRDDDRHQDGDEDDEDDESTTLAAGDESRSSGGRKEDRA